MPDFYGGLIHTLVFPSLYPSVPSGTTRLAIWDAGAPGTVTTSGGNVTGWADALGNANASLALTSGSNGLTLVPNLSPNGTPAVNASAANSLALQSTAGNPNGWLTNTASATTILLVMKIGTSHGGTPFIIGPPTGNYLSTYIGSSGSPAQTWVQSSGTAYSVAAGSVSATGLHKVVIRWNVGTMNWFHNTDTKITAAGVVTSISPSQLSVFRDFGSGVKDCALFEVHLYAGAASDADCAALISYATTKHGTLT